MGQEKESNKLCKILYWFGYYGEKNVLIEVAIWRTLVMARGVELVLQDNCLMSEGELGKNEDF